MASVGCGIAPLKENNIFLRAIKEAPFLPPRYSHAPISPSVACMGGREDCVPGAVPPVLFSFSVPSGFYEAGSYSTAVSQRWNWSTERLSEPVSGGLRLGLPASATSATSHISRSSLTCREGTMQNGSPRQTQDALSTRAQSVIDASLSLGKEKPVANEKAQPPSGFRQGSCAGLCCPIGGGELAGPRWSEICRAAASSGSANNRLHCFP